MVKQETPKMCVYYEYNYMAPNFVLWNTQKLSTDVLLNNL